MTLLLLLLRCYVDTAVRVDVCRLGLISLYTLDCGLCVVSYLLVIVLVDGSECAFLLLSHYVFKTVVLSC